MKIEDAKQKIIQCHSEGRTLCVLLLIIQFSTELLKFFTEYLKEKNDAKKNTTENQEFTQS
jgi:hypothetical protein